MQLLLTHLFCNGNGYSSAQRSEHLCNRTWTEDLGLFEDSQEPGEHFHLWVTDWCCSGAHPTHHIQISAEISPKHSTLVKFALGERTLQKLYLLFLSPRGPRNLYFLYWGKTTIKEIDSYCCNCISRETSEL